MVRDVNSLCLHIHGSKPLALLLIHFDTIVTVWPTSYILVIVSHENEVKKGSEREKEMK